MAKTSMDKRKERDLKVVKGKFFFDECRGGAIKFTYGGIYKEYPPKKYYLRDGEIYELPLMVVDHINNNCWYPVHSHAVDAEGKPSIKIGKRVSRATFNPLVFTPDGDFMGGQSNIVTVEKV